MIPHAEKLFETAKAGTTKLTAKERRHVVAFLMATDPTAHTNEQLAEIFKVTERTIRVDKHTIREGKAKVVKDDDVGLVIADILLDYERVIADLEKSKLKTALGSKERRMHNESIMDLRLKITKALQELGYYPKNLGTMSVNKYEFRTEVPFNHQLPARAADLFSDSPQKALPETIEAEIVEGPTSDAQAQEAPRGPANVTKY